MIALLYVCFPLSSDRQHLSYGGCLEIKREYCQDCSVLCCAHQYVLKYEQFLNLRLVIGLD